MKKLIIVSSVTGNTLKVAKAAYEAVSDCTLVNANKEITNLDDYECVVIAFWLDSGHADDLSLKIIEKLTDKKVILLGTLGGDPSSAVAQTIMNDLASRLDKSNTLIGTKWIQGRIHESVLEKMYEMFPNLKNDENHLKRVQEAKSHPNDDDLKNVSLWMKDLMEE